MVREMELEDVRALKQQLLAGPEQAAVGGGPQAGVALGVHPAPGGGFRLAVRVQRSTADATVYVRAADGEADVRTIGMVRAFERTARVRPLQTGVSVAEVDVTAGTLGCFVTVGDEARILSNNHVLADEDRARPGAAVLQPGPADGGQDPADRVGALDRAVALRTDAANRVDAALATVEVELEAGPIAGLGTLSGATLAAAEARRVAKLGRTTGLTRGSVTAFELDGLMVEYDAGALRFDGQVEVHGDAGPFSQGGDSGSLIVAADTLDAVALLFAGNEEGVTYGNPIGAVLDAFDATIRA
jgi:hypothetical protein